MEWNNKEKVIKTSILNSTKGSFEGSYMYIETARDIKVGNTIIFTIKKYYRYTKPYLCMRHKDTTEFYQTVIRDFELLKYEYFERVNLLTYILNTHIKN